MILSDLDKVENGRCLTRDGGEGSGTKGHVTAKQMAAMKERKSQQKSIDPGVAQAEFNIGYKAFKNGEKKQPRTNTTPALQKFWIQGYEKAENSFKKDREESENWHEEQKSRAFRR